MTIKSVEELLIRELMELEDAEQQTMKLLRRHVTDMEESRLRKLLEQRLYEGQRVLSDVRSCLERLDGNSDEIENPAVRGLIAQIEERVTQAEAPELRKIALVSGAQKLEHYCIACWGTARALAREIGEKELAERMQGALDEGYRWDRQMSELAQRRVNPAAPTDSV